MAESKTNLEAFDGCKNRSFKVRSWQSAEVICAQYPETGMNFDKVPVIDQNNRAEREHLAMRLGCAACPYADESMTRVIIERFDELGQPVKETRFEPFVPVRETIEN